jgi:hypothetical protein
MPNDSAQSSGRQIRLPLLKTMPKKANSKANPSPTTIPGVLTGVAGEYFVAAELSRRGYIASISLRNTRGIDILATNQASTRNITIQCKTNQSGARNWVLNEKSETFFAPDHYYVFVALGSATERPRFHVVPSQTVATYITESHQRWLRTPGRRGQQHVDSVMRKFREPDDIYLDRWDLLGL